MLKRHFLVLLLISAFLVIPTQAQTECFWFEGQISTAVTEQIYSNVRYYCFNLTVYHSNNTAFLGGENVSVVLDKNLTGLSPVENQSLNVTGYFNEVFTGEIPEGAFVVTQINTGSNNTLDVIKSLIMLVSSVMSGIANVLAGIIQLTLGITIPPILISVVLAIFFGWFVLSNWKKLALVAVLVLAFLVVSGGASLIRFAVWHI